MILFRARSVKHEKLADDLHAGGAEFFGELQESRFPLIAVATGNAYLDQFVRGQGAVDLLDDGVGQAGVAEQNDRIQMVRSAAQGQSFVAGQDQFAHDV